MAMGMLVVLPGDSFIESRKEARPGKKYPEKTPANIARKIQTVRYLSVNFNWGDEGIYLFIWFSV